jgi:hypothetical protein
VPRTSATQPRAPIRVDGALLVYHRPIPRWFKDASTVMEHVGSFRRHSRLPLWEVNTDTGFPEGLAEVEFSALLLHYSVFGMGLYWLDEGWRRYIRGTSAYKVAFFQDECTRCRRRFRFLDEHCIDCVYTCLEPSEFDKVYGRYTRVPRLVSNIPGYVSDDLVEAGRRFAIPDERRTIDVGYRGRPLPPYLGRGALEKHSIGVRFGELAADSGLCLDLAGGESDRLYGDDWYRFMANCRCVLGVESGASAFDLEDEVLEEFTRLQREQGEVALEDLESLRRWEDRVYYRTISPRHFEAAALRVCQILFEGRYSGILEPMVHYVPLRKDLSNIEDVIGLIKQPDVRRELTERGYRDLIASGDWSYRRFVQGVDNLLTSQGVEGREDPAAVAGVDAALRRGSRLRRSRRAAEWALRRALGTPTARRIVLFLHPLTSRVRRLLRIPAPGESN